LYHQQLVSRITTNYINTSFFCTLVLVFCLSHKAVWAIIWKNKHPWASNNWHQCSECCIYFDFL